MEHKISEIPLLILCYFTFTGCKSWV